MDGHAVLLVAVPELEAWVRARTAHYDRRFVSADPAFAHAHVTVLAPFPAERADLVAAVASRIEPFDYVLERVEAFPDGVVHLVPEPAEGFRRLTDAACALAPEVEPYWGRHPDPVPHLTLDRLGAGVSIASTRALLGDLVPARCRADRLLLTWWRADECRVLASAPLGGGPR